MSEKVFCGVISNWCDNIAKHQGLCGKAGWLIFSGPCFHANQHIEEGLKEIIEEIKDDRRGFKVEFKSPTHQERVAVVDDPQKDHLTILSIKCGTVSSTTIPRSES
jgi:hypothetical protein